MRKVIILIFATIFWGFLISGMESSLEEYLEEPNLQLCHSLQAQALGCLVRNFSSDDIDSKCSSMLDALLKKLLGDKCGDESFMRESFWPSFYGESVDDPSSVADLLKRPEVGVMRFLDSLSSRVGYLNIAIATNDKRKAENSGAWWYCYADLMSLPIRYNPLSIDAFLSCSHLNAQEKTWFITEFLRKAPVSVLRYFAHYGAKLFKLEEGVVECNACRPHLDAIGLNTIVDCTLLRDDLVNKAVEAEDIELFKLWYDVGVDFGKGKLFESVLHKAIHKRTVDEKSRDQQNLLIKFLIDHGASINAQDWYGDTTLHGALKELDLEEAGYEPRRYKISAFAEERVKTLLEHNAKVNAVNNDGMTPLHRAAEFGLALVNRLDIVKLLLKYGAAVDIIDKEGKTAYDRARKQGDSVVANCLHNSHRTQYILPIIAKKSAGIELPLEIREHIACLMPTWSNPLPTQFRYSLQACALACFASRFSKNDVQKACNKEIRRALEKLNDQIYVGYMENRFKNKVIGLLARLPDNIVYVCEAIDCLNASVDANDKNRRIIDDHLMRNLTQQPLLMEAFLHYFSFRNK